jgi:hypothetical protein
MLMAGRQASGFGLIQAISGWYGLSEREIL